MHEDIKSPHQLNADNMFHHGLLLPSEVGNINDLAATKDEI